MVFYHARGGSQAHKRVSVSPKWHENRPCRSQPSHRPGNSNSSICPIAAFPTNCRKKSLYVINITDVSNCYDIVIDHGNLVIVLQFFSPAFILCELL